MIAKLLLISVCCMTLCSSDPGKPKSRSRWAYEDQYNWPQSCRGQYQSPIDLPDICYPKSDSRVTIDAGMRYDPQGYNRLLPYQRMRIVNNGHTLSMVVDGWDYVSDDVPSISVNAGRSRSQYQFTELHFHWAHDGTQGSEHSIAGSRKAMEMHLVHFNKRYRSKDVASSQPDGLLVLGVLFHEDTMENPSLDPIVDQIQYVHETNNSVPARRSFSLQSILPPDTSIFYLYKGSLTTPPCSESVTWLIIAEVQKLGYSQLREFQKMSNDGDRLRDLQDTNGRPIYANSNAHCSKNPSQGYGNGGNTGGYGNNNAGFGSGTGNGNGNSGYGGDGSSNWNKPQGSNNGYGGGNRPPGQGNDGYGNGRPQPDSGYDPIYGGGGGGGGNRPGNRPDSGNNGYPSSSSGDNGGYRPTGSGGSDQSWGQRPPQGNNGYGGSNFGNRPDSGYTSGSGYKPGFGNENSRPPYGQSSSGYGSRGTAQASGSSQSHKTHRGHKSEREMTAKSSESGVVFPAVST